MVLDVGVSGGGGYFMSGFPGGAGAGIVCRGFRGEMVFYVRVSVGGILFCVPQSDPCSAHRLHKCVHGTGSKDPG